ncbi:MAG: OsmC family protein [Chitinophagaceae bacterium]|nr:OsmC family protein [Chitinophagaceae bacterium]
MVTTTIWKTGEDFESKFNKSRIEVSGNNGFSPKALLLSALGACSGIDVVMILEKMRVPFGDLKIDTEAEQTDTDPKVFKDIRISYRIKTDEENRDKVIRAIKLSLEKYCGVAAMLKKHSRISYELIIENIL